MNGDQLLRKLKKLAKIRGVELRTASGKGNHVKVYFGSAMTVLPGRKEEIKTGTLAGILKQLGISKADLEEV